ncbi:cold shock domain-containing protein [Streptomyces sp. NPDC094049]|uniref:cold-shock protein n=1 Tax=Streptomyces sp. NPDC094049 TaxID=3154987 RepID=UPI00332245DB
MATGTVKIFNTEKGYGYITQDDGGKDAYVHFTAIVTDGFKTLEAGQRVSYTLAPGGGGATAQQVTKI